MKYLFIILLLMLVGCTEKVYDLEPIKIVISENDTGDYINEEMIGASNLSLINNTTNLLFVGNFTAGQMNANYSIYMGGASEEMVRVTMPNWEEIYPIEVRMREDYCVLKECEGDNICYTCYEHPQGNTSAEIMAAVGGTVSVVVVT